MSDRWKIELKTQDIENSCPWMRYKPEEDKVTNCDGTVTWTVGSAVGVCKSCGRDVPSSLEM